jgi:hypothetical protein
MRVRDGHLWSVVRLFMLLVVLSAPTLSKAQYVELAHAVDGVSKEESTRRVFRQMELEGMNPGSSGCSQPVPPVVPSKQRVLPDVSVAHPEGQINAVVRTVLALAKD